MPSLDDVARAHTGLAPAEVEWLHDLVSDWQMLADLSFADLVLWLPDAEELGFWVGAQMRPTTGTTAFIDDLVGGFVPRERRQLIDQAYATGRICREGDPEWRDDVPVRVEAIPVCRAGRVLAVIARSTNLLSVRTPSRLELTYLQVAGHLATMISQGRFPNQAGATVSSSPRVGDGIVLLDAAGAVSYISPNGLSAYRRLGRQGDLVGELLGESTVALLPASRRPVEESLATLLHGRSAAETEVEGAQATVMLRVIPLEPDGQHVGALVLVRDVTDLRHRERELLSREATIREVHHRVKNNLQTVAALLRLQARRTGEPVARQALDEAVRRVGSIAVVHEILSQTFDERVDFDMVADRLLIMVGDVASPEADVAIGRVGSVGAVDAETATALAMAVMELLQNAVEHGLAGRSDGHVTVTARRLSGRIRLTIDDDGVGLPEGFDLASDRSLGLQIVRSLVETELEGEFTLGARPDASGTRATIEWTPST